MMPSRINKHSITLGGCHTKVSLEDKFWDELRHMAIDRHTTVQNMVADIDKERRKHQQKNLSSAIRLFVLGEVRRRVGATG